VIRGEPAEQRSSGVQLGSLLARAVEVAVEDRGNHDCPPPGGRTIPTPPSPRIIETSDPPARQIHLYSVRRWLAITAVLAVPMCLAEAGMALRVPLDDGRQWGAPAAIQDGCVYQDGSERAGWTQSTR
jgi:hypothetical protein